MFENHKLCSDLKTKEMCLVVEQYNEGTIERKFHMHVPKHRLSEDALAYLLKALVIKFENNEPLTIVRSFLNSRGKNPSARNFNFHVTYPEPGVMRKYCGANTCAWADQVVVPSSFRSWLGLQRIRVAHPRSMTRGIVFVYKAARQPRRAIPISWIAFGAGHPGVAALARWRPLGGATILGYPKAIMRRIRCKASPRFSHFVLRKIRTANGDSVTRLRNGRTLRLRLRGDGFGLRRLWRELRKFGLRGSHLGYFFFAIRNCASHVTPVVYRQRLRLRLRHAACGEHDREIKYCVRCFHLLISSYRALLRGGLGDMIIAEAS
jgi:hypothetical protein